MGDTNPNGRALQGTGFGAVQALKGRDRPTKMGLSFSPTSTGRMRIAPVSLVALVVGLMVGLGQLDRHYLAKDFLTIVDNPAGPRGAQRSRYEFVSTGGPWLATGKPRGARPSEPEASERATSTPFGWTQSRWGWGRWVSEIPMPLVRPRRRQLLRRRL